jgi:GDP-mannose transporter
LQAYGEVVWFQGKVTCLTLLAFMLMVSSSVIAAWSDIAHISWLQNLPVPHLPDGSLYGGTKDPVTGNWVQAPNPLQKVQDGITAQMKEAGLGDDGAVFENMAGGAGAGGLGWGTLNSGYVWMAANCLCSAAYVRGHASSSSHGNLR